MDELVPVPDLGVHDAEIAFLFRVICMRSIQVDLSSHSLVKNP